MAALPHRTKTRYKVWMRQPLGVGHVTNKFALKRFLVELLILSFIQLHNELLLLN